MALDLRGRILGYGFGGGEARQISVCPGSRVAAELVARGRQLGVAVRGLRLLRRLSYARLPVNTRGIQPSQATLRCQADDASSVHAEVRDYQSGSGGYSAGGALTRQDRLPAELSANTLQILNDGLG
jgi:hypothetical protein